MSGVSGSIWFCFRLGLGAFLHSRHVWVIFFVNFRLFSENFSLSASNFPSPYFQFVQEYGMSIGNRTEWSTIQRVIGRVISNLEIASPIIPELYDTKSCYQLIEPITKWENLSLGIFFNVKKSH